MKLTTILISDSDSHLIESYCGSSGRDGVVSAEDGHLYLSFSTDSSSTHDGFRLNYRQIPDSEFIVCPSNARASVQSTVSVKSPAYNNYAYI